jgi:hypothetical protein
MRYKEFITENKTLNAKEFGAMMGKFLEMAANTLNLDRLPKIKITDEIIDAGGQPSFGMYLAGKNILVISLGDRHPIDVLRTLAHELTHYRQDIIGKLNQDSGRTGSPEENEAHHMAGIIMRNFSKKYPEYMMLSPLV